MNTGYIGNLTVRSRQPYIVYGSVRGLVSAHRTQGAAERSAKRDREDCRGLGGGAYSDVGVYAASAAGWTVVEESD